MKLLLCTINYIYDVCINVDVYPPRGRSLSRNASGSNSPIDSNRDLLDDYAEIVDEDGDYSIPASKFLLLKTVSTYVFLSLIN